MALAIHHTMKQLPLFLALCVCAAASVVTADGEDSALELYNVPEDISEQHNLAAKNPGKVKELHAKLIAWRKEVGALMPTPNPEFDPKKKKQK